MAKNETTRPVWRVNYSWVNAKGYIRNGAVVVEANDANEANKTAESMLTGLLHVRITGTKQY